LLGNFHGSKRTPEAIDKAIEYFRQAIRIDPGYAQAYAGLASAYLEREIWGGVGIGNSADQVRANTLKALELDEDFAEGHALLGRICFEYDWDWARTDREYRRALELNANLPGAYEGYALFLQAMGRHQEALAAVHRAVELDPLSAWYISEEGRVLYRARRYGDAITRYQRALELDPAFVPALARMADAYEQLGKYDEALSYAQKLQQMPSNRKVGLRMLARIYASSMGKRHEAEEILRTIEKGGAPGGGDYARAVIYSALGDRDHAIAALERGAQKHSFFPFIFVDPQLDSLRSDPRFNELLRRVHLR
jgi:tetratricopeptide (TPR) repeat protein